MKMLLVDGSNMVMRCALGGQLQPDVAVRTATAQIRRVASQLESERMVICLDLPGVKTWRHAIYPAYKSTRKVDTSDWLEAAESEWAKIGWKLVAFPGFEADDAIATLVARFPVKSDLQILSGDSDLLPLLESGARIYRMIDGSPEEYTHDDFVAKFGFHKPALVTTFKAMAGESSDNIPGVPTIGPRKAEALTSLYGDLDDVILFGLGPGDGVRTLEHKWARQVVAHAESAQLSKCLASLRIDVPIPLITPADCKIV